MKPTEEETAITIRSDYLYGSALSFRCPHCHKSTDLPVQASLGEVTCSSCGQIIQLVDDKLKEDPKQFGHFELIEPLGSGSFGTVWKARDTELDRIVAIKVPRKQQLSASEAADFLRDAQSAAQLRHKNIVSVYEVGQQDSTIYIVSEFIAGTTLAERLTTGPLAIRPAVELMLKLAEALIHAHGLGIIHRDIKPQNVMLDGENEPFLIDFGLAKKQTSEVTMTLDGRLVGTPAYMSPEQARGFGNQADARSDLYSLGVMLYELLTGERPFRGSLQMVIQQVLEDEPLSPRRLSSHVPRDLETIVLKLLQKSPENRYQSAKELHEDLVRFQQNIPIKARPVSGLERSWRWYLRNFTFGNLIIAVVLLLCALSIGATVAATRYQDQASKLAKNSRILKKQIYFNGIALAEREWLNNDSQQALSILKSCEELQREFEWHYLHGMFHRELQLVSGDAGTGHLVALSPDGRWMASSNEEGDIKVYEVASGNLKQEFSEHTKPPSVLRFTLDNRLVSGGADGAVIVWDIEKGNRLDQVSLGLPIVDLDISQDNTMIAVATADRETGEGGFSLGQLESLQTIELFDGPRGLPYAIRFDPRNPDHLFLGKDIGVSLWNRQEKKQILEFYDSFGAIDHLACSLDGQYVATSCTDRTVRVWDTTSGQEIRTFRGTTRQVTSLAIDRQNRLAASSMDGSVVVWDILTTSELWRIRGHMDGVLAVAFDGSGSKLLTGGEDRTLRVWNAVEGPDPRLQTPHAKLVSSHPTREMIATAGDDFLIKLWDVAGRKRLATLSGHQAAIKALEFDSTGARLASASDEGEIRLWNVETRELIKSHSLKGSVIGLSFFNDGGLLVVLDDGRVFHWSPEEQLPVQILETSLEGVTSIDLSADETELALGSAEGRISVWSIPDRAQGSESSREPILQIHVETQSNRISDQGIHAVRFSPDQNFLAAGGADRQVRIWSIRGEESGSKILPGHNGVVRDLVWSANGHRLFSAGDDQRILIHETETGREILSLSGHSGTIRSLMFDSSRNRLYSTGDDETVRIWDGGVQFPSSGGERQQLDETGTKE